MRAVVDVLQYLPMDIEELGIGPIKVFIDIGLVAHESLMGPITYHGDIVTWCVTERCWHCNANASSRSSSQSPRPEPSQGSSLVIDVSGPSPSNTYSASDKIIFRSTRTLAKKHVEKSTWQCTFVPNADCPHSFIRYVLICYSANIASLEFMLLEKNCYYYTAVVIRLLEEVVGGEIQYGAKDVMGMNGRDKILAGEDVTEAVGKIREIYETLYGDFMAVVSAL